MKEIFKNLNPTIGCAILVVIHRMKNVESKLEEVLQHHCPIKITEANDKESVLENSIYIAPSNYHVLIERDGRFSLSVSEIVNFSRPSIDVSFFSLAESYGANAAGIVLTGANKDGSDGLMILEKMGAKVIVQNIEEAQVKVMPQAALEKVTTAKELNLKEIAQYINREYAEN